MTQMSKLSTQCCSLFHFSAHAQVDNFQQTSNSFKKKLISPLSTGLWSNSLEWRSPTSEKHENFPLHLVHLMPTLYFVGLETLCFCLCGWICYLLTKLRSCLPLGIQTCSTWTSLQNSRPPPRRTCSLWNANCRWGALGIRLKCLLVYSSINYRKHFNFYPGHGKSSLDLLEY